MQRDHGPVLPRVPELVILSRDLEDADPVQRQLAPVRDPELHEGTRPEGARHDDLMEAVARPLPVIVMAEMLGVPAEDRARFAVWAAQRARLLEPTISRRERRAGGAASRAFNAYFRPIIEERRTAPREDIVSALVRAQDEGAHLSECETLNMLRLLLSAGPSPG